jgi:hypothetical protein
VPAQELSGLTAWMPGNAADSEWAEYYRFFSLEFGVTIDTSGPVFGRDHITERIGASPDLITFAAKTQLTGSPVAAGPRPPAVSALFRRAPSPTAFTGTRAPLTPDR